MSDIWPVHWCLQVLNFAHRFIGWSLWPAINCCHPPKPPTLAAVCCWPLIAAARIYSALLTAAHLCALLLAAAACASRHARNCPESCFKTALPQAGTRPLVWCDRPAWPKPKAWTITAPAHKQKRQGLMHSVYLKMRCENRHEPRLWIKRSNSLQIYVKILRRPNITKRQLNNIIKFSNIL